MKSDPTKHTQGKFKRDVFTRTYGGEWSQDDIDGDAGQRFQEVRGHAVDMQATACTDEFLMSIGGRCVISVRAARSSWRFWEKPRLVTSAFYPEGTRESEEAQLEMESVVQ